jgi:hypothetical protein
MNEKQIAEQLTQNIPQDTPVVDDKPVTATKPEPSAFESNVELNDPAIGLEIADFFGITKVDRFSEERQQQLRALYKWGAERAGSKDRSAVIMQLHLLERELGATFKPDRLATMSRWVKLDKQAEAIRQEQGFINGV